ncbi:MFS transporter [Xylocopilactobacillus apicola]|uniref:MFS transporter n=1 Tax=Xylocopilactobacillus apicola TaxID=2932184 RepID=A0AAU9DYR9_9LACO|nr:MFS transporter [Xylocopilactobacillus apicola]BDR59358.1 MFS transporter [Xylocopilactobacillus apicola]
MEQQSTSRNQRQTVLSTSAGFALENMDIMFLSFALTPIISTLRISGAAAGLISSITNLGMLVGGVIFGLLGDRIGRVKTFSYTIFIFAFATAGMYFAKDIGVIYLLRFIAGIGAGGEYGVGIALIAENFPKNKVGRITSIAAVGGQVGAIFAAVMAAVIIPRFGWNTLFLFGLLPVVLAFLVRHSLQESPEFLASQKSNETKEKISLAELFTTKKQSYQTIALMFMVVVQIAGYFGLMNWLPSIMQKQLHINVSGSSIWMIATIIGMSIGMMVFGTILDRLGPRMAYSIFLVGSAVSVFLITLATNELTLILAGAVLGFFSNGMFGGYGAIISRLYPTHIRATANNLIVNVGRAIGGFSSVVIGFLMDHSNLTVTMGFLSLLYVLSLCVMFSIPALKGLNISNKA